MELLYGTANEGKLLVMRRALAPMGITVTGLKERKMEIPLVPETGSSLIENARKKAKAYFAAFQSPVFSCDTGLYFKNVPEELQPGIYVRRPLGYEMTDDEMTAYYRGLAEKYGDLQAQYRNAVCLVKSAQEIYESDDLRLSGKPFVITSRPHSRSQPGFPLDRLSIQISSGRYYYELPEDAQDEVALGAGICEFFLNTLGGIRE
ncbi:hypothetical protein D3Z36_04660 [Lachnospiraceae bacterium]|nr:hypothetical protein [Lachnospiraceae bacterium]